MAKSDFILGRRANRAAWVQAEETGRSFCVMAYGHEGKLRFADCNWIGSRKHRKTHVNPARPMDPKATIARIRVIVTPKKFPEPVDDGKGFFQVISNETRRDEL